MPHSKAFSKLSVREEEMKTVVKIFYVLLLVMLFTSFTDKHSVAEKTFIVVIDPGHGGKDPGAISKKVQEKTITLDIAKKLGKMLTDSFKDIKVVYTRSKDTFITLHDRANIANRNKATIFISIHCNQNKNTTPNGSETYVMGLHKSDDNLEVAKRENEAVLYEDNYENEKDYEGFDPNSPEAHIIFSFYQNLFLDQSLTLASGVEKHLGKRKKVKKSRGVKQAGFLVLWKTTMPSILIETGFISNTAEREYLASDTGKKEVATSVYKAIKDYRAYLEKIK